MAADVSRPSVLWELVAESADEAEFLFRQWERALCSPSYNLQDVSRWVEDRLLGAMDGIRAGGRAAYEEVQYPALASDEPTRICAAACVLAQAAAPDGLDALAQRWRQARGPALAAVRRGVELVASASLLSALRWRLHDAAVPAQAALLQAHAFCGADPGSMADQAMASGEPLLRSAALRVAARLPQRVDRGMVEEALGASDPAVVNAAIEAGLVAGSPAALCRLAELLERPSAGSGVLLCVLAILGGPGARARLVAALSDERRLKVAVFALAYSGTRAAADTCVELLRQGLVPRLAADALGIITGLDLRASKLVRPEPDGEDAPIPFEQDDLDAELALMEEDLLPLPDVDGVVAWWNQRRAAFRPEVRYLAGQPVSPLVLWQTLAQGPMRRRPPLALEVAIQRREFLLRTDAFTQDQWRQLRQLQTAPDCTSAYAARGQYAERG